MLAERSGDPDVERLIEGFAFLAARIREKIDDSVPEVVHHLADLVFPHFLRPVPATSIIEFTPNIPAMGGGLSVERGTEVLAKPLEETACQFRTTQVVDIVPARILDVVVDRSSADKPKIRIVFEGSDVARDAMAMPGKSLRLFLQGELALTTTLRLWLLRYCRSFRVRSADGRELELGTRSIQPAGFHADEALVPWPDFAPQGLRYLQEYFCLPEKFLFIDIQNLELARDLIGERFELVFSMDHPPELPGELQSNSVRLHCTPIVNIFDTNADPIGLSTFTREKVIRAAALDPDHMEVYSVNKVVGIRPGRAERREYQRFFDYSQAAPNSGQHYYQLSHVQSPINDGLDVYLSVHTPRDIAPDTEDQTLSIDVSCTNRSLPAELRVGDITEPGLAVPSLVTLRNILPVTMPVRPPMGSELHWRLLSHLSMNYSSLADKTRLAAICNLYNFQGAQDSSLSYANRRRSDGIRGVQSASARRVMNRAPVRGVATTVELEAANYSSLGEAELFGSILNEIFAARVAINSFHELTIQVQPFNIEYTWPARNGQLAIS